jgi:hypothetical protein
MRRIILLLASVATTVLSVSGIVLALPSETPDDAPMVDGHVRAFAKVGGNVWVGGSFSRVEQRDGAVTEDVGNAAVFDSATGRYLDIAPKLGGEGSTVYDLAVYGDDVVIAGDFSGPGAEENNLVVVDGATGEVIRWYDSPPVWSALAKPGLGRIYGGGASLSAFDFDDGEKLWTRARASMNPGLRPNSNKSGYRDLELDGSTIWAACVCDSVDGNAAKALVKLDTEGNHDHSGVSEAKPEAFGISVTSYEGSVYLGAGGNDFLASYPADGGGRRAWERDTSGSVQVVEKMEDQLIVGGHFWEVADGAGDACGHRSGDNAATLDPSYADGPHYPNPDPDQPDDRCATRHGLAAYSFEGDLDPDWSPMLSGGYSLAWALRPETATGRLHVGGEFTEVDEVRQEHYATLPPVPLP